MQFGAKAKFLRFSPYKLRPLVDVVRGKNVRYALDWLSTAALKKALPIKKLIESAAANAKQHKDIETQGLIIRDIRVDEGPVYKYFKAGAMGRSSIQRRRLSHMSVIVESIDKKEA